MSDGRHTDDGPVTVEITVVNDAPVFPAATAARSVPEDAEAGDNVGAPVTATDVDEGDTLRYSLSGSVRASSEQTARLLAIGEDACMHERHVQLGRELQRLALEGAQRLAEGEEPTHPVRSSSSRRQASASSDLLPEPRPRAPRW